jgi:hypothetical protein
MSGFSVHGAKGPSQTTGLSNTEHAIERLERFERGPLYLTALTCVAEADPFQRWL